ncbi:hypothetical protein E1750_14380 [Flavobacterium nackdongense]|uniref:Adenylosuccinate lyase n=2 Tax=Flavobacterium nackdongense TaxID=2547394 RepID=A0A4V1AH85_9FLAO|nr:hypothetical protein E1750_14380 [Flavobacterium nackdongense]
MEVEFEKKLNSVTGHRANRQQLANEVLENKEIFLVLTQYCFQFSNKSVPKAFWILELLCYQKLEWLVPHLDLFCSKIKNLTQDSAIRPAAKIVLLLTISHFKKKEILLTENQLQQITETCFDWLLTDTKVASKCYAIRSLYLIGHHFDWIHPELKIILEKEYTSHSAAFQAVGREILRKINKQK